MPMLHAEIKESNQLSVYICTQIDTSEITSRIIRSTSSFQNASKSHVGYVVWL